jgi:hypothetical protein
LSSSTYSIDIEKGWQLVGVPTNIENMDSFQNSNVRLVWSYDRKNQKWLAFSPDTDIKAKISNNDEVGEISQIEIDSSIWIYSYEAWTLELDETIKYTDSTALNIDKIDVQQKWNLISLPIDTVVDIDTVFVKDDSFKGIWKYGKNKDNTYDWQTTASPYYDTSITELNSKDGVWIYNDSEDMVINIASASNKIHNFSKIEDVKSRILKLLEIKNRKTHHWIDNEYISKDVTSNALITNINEATENIPTFAKDDGENIFFLDKNDTTKNGLFYESFEQLASLDTNPNVVAMTVLDSYDYQIKDFHLKDITVDNVNKTRAIVLAQATRNDLTENSSLSESCQENRVAYSFIDVVKSNITSKTQTYYSVDGTLKDSRLIGEFLYIISEFEPCIEFDYAKSYLESSDICWDKNPEYNYDSATGGFLKIGETANTVTEQNQTTQSLKAVTYTQLCSDVIMEKNETTNLYKPYRLDYANVNLSEEATDQYLYPKYYESSDEGKEMIIPNKFYSTLKLNQNPKITTVTKVNLETKEVDNQIHFLGNTDSHLTSSNNLYLINHDYPEYFSFNEYKDQTSILKFSLYPELEYKAQGTISGSLLNQYAISEDPTATYLRVLTQETYSWKDSTELKYKLTSLKENSETSTLEEFHSIDNVTSDTNFEKELKFIRYNKDIGLALYEDDNGYQMYRIIDFNDPTTPALSGRILETTQEFDYIYSVEINAVPYLITVGRIEQDNTKRIEIKLYNLSTLNNVEREAFYQFGDSSNYIPLAYDSEAFMFDPETLTFGFPVSTSTYNRTALSVENGFHLFQLQQSTTSTKYTITNLGITPPLLTDYTNFYGARGIVFDYEDEKYMSFISLGKITTKKLLATE